MGRVQNTINGMEISTLKVGYHLLQQILPLFGEVFSPDYTHRIAQLKNIYIFLNFSLWLSKTI